MYLQNTNLYMEIFSSGSKQKHKKTNYQLLLITSLKKEIESALKLCLKDLAAEIRVIGFSCRHCGKCCRWAFGDNRVMLIPTEIEKIREFTGLSKLEIAGPFVPEIVPLDRLEENENITEGFLGASEETGVSFSPEILELIQENIDRDGNIHAFGWMLRQNSNLDCIFLEKSTSKCQVYPVRPMLCKTYPFYIKYLKLHTCECEGLGYPISAEDSQELAENLFYRYVSELEDMLAMYKEFVNFKKGEKGLELAKKKLVDSTCTYIVHDSTGNYKFIDY
jgi:Fe-S-cluster containining protein